MTSINSDHYSNQLLISLQLDLMNNQMINVHYFPKGKIIPYETTWKYHLFIKSTDESEVLILQLIR